MTSRATLAWALACALGVAGTSAFPAGAGPARERLAAGLRGLRDVRATFRQTRDAGALGRTVARGTLEFKAPALVRLEYAGAAPMTILLHGDTAWVYQPDQKQVLRSSAGASGVPPLPFLTTSVARLDERYRVEERGPNELTLMPRAGDALAWTKLVLTLDVARGLPSRVVLHMRDGGTTALVFERFRVNSGIGAMRFRAVWPAGIPVVVL